MRRTAWFGLALVLGCGEPDEEMMSPEAEADTEMDGEGLDASSCAELFNEAQCLGGAAPRVEVGDVEVPEGVTEPTVVAEFDGGRLVEGMPGDVQVIHADDGCLVSCVWMQPQTRFCEAVNEDGEKTCVFGTNQELSLDDCMQFVEACAG